jgi:3-ketosteroid 9alpha-monooxygenase subunit B
VTEPERFALTVRAIERETAEACTVTFDVPAEAADRFRYKPGQFLTLRLPCAGGTVARCYSLCSSPDVDGALQVAVKRVRDGVASNWVNDTLTVGDTVECLVPGGTFTPRSLAENLLLFAGGSGITPVLSILKSALAVGTGKVTLVYANQAEEAVMFAGPLRSLAEQYPERLHVIHWLESLQGLPTRAQLKAFAAPFTSYTCFVCGPSPFMESVSHSLRELGVPPSRIHIERFQSLADDPFAAVALPEPPGDGRLASVEVELDGEKHTFDDWPADTKLLDFLLSKGLKAPFSCRQGACSACACILNSGEVKMITNDILEQDDLDEGFVLACQSLPVSDHLSVRYD